jgi:nucleotide-binding universal stress UspA family protein
MFKHILIPTDGSELSLAAMEKGVALASEIGAKITALHVIPDYQAIGLRMEMLEVTRSAYMIAAKQAADEALGAARRAASAAGVECEVHSAEHENPYKAIIEAAMDRHCDLIIMASHGRRGLSGLILGSETQKVLTHSTLPVLVYR